MGTLKTNYEKYLELWDLFEKEINTSKKFDNKTLYGFSKYYANHNNPDEENDYKKVYDKLRRMQERKDGGIFKSVNNNTLLYLNMCHKFLKKDYFSQELLDDERPEHWFD